MYDCIKTDFNDRIIDEVLISIPSISQKIILRILFNIYDDFFITTKRWRYLFVNLTTTEDSTIYEIPNDDDVEIIKVIDVFRTLSDNEEKIPERGDVWKRRDDDYYSSDNTINNFYYNPSPNTIILNKQESADLRISVALKPVRGRDRLPEFINIYFEGILAGVLSKILLMPNKEWSSLELGSFNMEIYIQSKKDAISFHNMNLNGDRPVIHRPIFGHN